MLCYDVTTQTVSTDGVTVDLTTVDFSLESNQHSVSTFRHPSSDKICEPKIINILKNNISQNF